MSLGQLLESKPLQAITTIGLGAVIAWFAFNHLMDSDKAADDFVRGELVKYLVENAKAETEQAKATTSLVEAIKDMADQIDQVGDESRTMNRNLERFWSMQLTEHASEE